MVEVGIFYSIAQHSIAQHSIAQRSMTSTFENETIGHYLTAYQHHVDYHKAFFIVLVHTEKRCYTTEIFCPFRFAEVAFLQERSDPQPAAVHISSISTSAFIKTHDLSVVLKLQCLKMQACSVVIISVSKQLSNRYIQGVGAPPITSPWVATKP